MHPFLDRLQQHVTTPNLGVADCLVRITLGLLLTAFAVDGTIGAWGFGGLFGLATGAAWFCPAYKLLGINTLSRVSGESLRG